MTSTVKLGSKWLASNRGEFWVIGVVEREGHVWIHYRNDQGQEFSCYQDSFLLRFTEHDNA
jgi:hypothetical protein